MKDMFSYSEMRSVKKSLNEQSIIYKTASELSMKNVFLSYNSDDTDKVYFLYDLLQRNGGRVYLDKYDTSLSKMDFQKVADRLSQAAQSCSKMVLLVTKKVSESIWIPWEIGLGHGFHSKSSVALFFASEDVKDTDWRDQEYLGMYQWIVDPEYTFKNRMSIYDPIDKNIKKSLTDWLGDDNKKRTRIVL